MQEAGIRRMVCACRDAGLPDPVFEELYEPKRTVTTIRIVPKGDELEMKVLRMLMDDGSASITSIAESSEVQR